MSLLAALARKGDPVEGRALQSSTLRAWGRGDDVASIDSATGVTVSRTTALGLSAVWACVSLIGDSVATLPVDLVDSTGIGRPAARPAWLDQPNPEQTRIDFIFSQVVSLLLDGSAFVYTVRDRMGEVVEAWVLDPSYVYVIREMFQGPRDPRPRMQVVYYVTVTKGLQSPVGPFRVPAGPDMFHVRGLSVAANDPRGLSPLEHARLMFGGAIAGQEMGARFFGQGMNAGGVIEVPDAMEVEQARELKEDFSRANSGVRKMHLPPVLTGGATWKQISVSPEQAQFLEHREYSVEDVARLFRVPPWMVGAMTKTTSWGAGIEQQGIGFVTYTLRPWIERLEESWSRWMLATNPNLRVSFNVDGLLRGDREARAKWYAAGRQWGWLSANDIRLEEGHEPIGPDGDLYLTPVNMTSPTGFPAGDPLPTQDAPPAPDTVTAGEA